MSDGGDPILEAVAALRARGHRVEPNDDHPFWRVDGSDWLTAGDLLALALGIELRHPRSRLQ